MEMRGKIIRAFIGARYCGVRSGIGGNGWLV